MLFMDHYAQASCTAGRAAFIAGRIRSASVSQQFDCQARSRA